MMIIFWLITLALFVFLTSLFFHAFFKDEQNLESFRTIKNGIKEALKDCGFHIKKGKYPVDLYVWQVLDEDQAYEECVERQNWEPMDIADWMKEGLPGTPEAGTCDGINCQCRLIRYKKKSLFKSQNPEK